MLITYLKGRDNGEFVSVLRNICNIGENENIIQFFENYTSDLVLISADDNFSGPDAINIVRSTIEKNPELGVINYCPHWKRTFSAKFVSSI